MPALIDLTGMRFGRLLVLEIAASRNKRVRWKCRCDCGVEKLVGREVLKSGHAKSCGCLNRELQISRPTTHGMTGTRIFAVWKTMRGRCQNPRDESFKNYGGRGIRVCERWSLFENFYADMGATYAPKLTIERKDNDADYSPGNCIWIPRSEQSRNRRNASIWQFKDDPISTSTTGLRGVHHLKSNGKWLASIMINGRLTKRVFDTKEDAAAFYKAEAKRRVSECLELDLQEVHTKQEV